MRKLLATIILAVATVASCSSVKVAESWQMSNDGKLEGITVM